MITPAEFKSPAPEPNRNALQQVQGLCAMTVYSVDQETWIPLQEALQEALHNVGLPIATPERLQEEYGRRDIYPALQNLITALDMYLKGQATPDDKQVIIDSPGIFEAVVKKLYWIVDEDKGSASVREMLDISPMDSETFNEFLRSAQDWKAIRIKSEKVAAAVKADIGREAT